MTETVTDQGKQESAKLQKREAANDEQAEEKGKGAFESGLFFF